MKTSYIFKTRIISKMIFMLLLVFIINSKAQSISSIQPNPVAPGQILSVLGTNLYTTTGISFAGGVSSTATGMFGGTSVTVPAGAMTGLITLTGPGMFLESITVLTVSSIPVTSISLTRTLGNMTTILGGNGRLFEPDVYPSNATNKKATWTVQPDYLGYIEPYGGTITENSSTLYAFNANGVITVTATSVSDPSVKTSITLTVVKNSSIINATSFSISPTSNCVELNDNVLFTTAVLPANANKNTAYWMSSDDALLEISNLGGNVGIFKSKASVGIVTITAIAINGGITAYSVLTIGGCSSTTGTSVTGVNVYPLSSTIAGGDRQLFMANVLPATVSNKDVTWSILPSNMGTIYPDGSFVAGTTTSGIVTITATSIGNPSVSGTTLLLINPAVLPTSIIITPSLVTIPGGTNQFFLAEVLPSNASNKNITWNGASAPGMIFPEGTFVATTTPGVLTITATSVVDPSVFATAIVNVTNAVPVPVSSINVSGPSTLTGGNSAQYTANVLPSNAADKSVTWSISPIYVGYIASDGTYTPPTTFTGVVTITATSVSNPSITGIAITTITPFVDVASVSVTPSILTVSGGGSQLFTANILPANATIKSVTWTSSNTIVGIINGSGLFTGLSGGTTTITATSVANPAVMDRVIVNVNPISTTSGNNCDPIHAGIISNGSVTGAELSYPLSVFVSGNYAYLVNSYTNTLQIINVSNSSFPILTGSLTHGTGGALLSGSISVFVSGNYAYVASSTSNALEIIDISNPALPVHKGSLTDGTGGAILKGPGSVYVSGNYAYVVSLLSNSLEVIDVSNPSAPTHKGSLVDGSGGALLNFPKSVYVSGNYAYVTSYNNEGALEIVDISNPAVPMHKGSLSKGDGGANIYHPVCVYVSGNYAYVASYYGNAIEIIDINNPASPVHKGSLINGAGGALLDGPYSVYVLGNYVYVASGYSSALEVIDASNPAIPIHKGSITNGTGGAQIYGPFSVYVSGNFAYVASPGSTMEIVSVSCTSTTPDLPRNEYFISIVNSGAQTVVVNGNIIVTWPTMAGVSTYCIQYSTDSTFATNVVTVCGLTTPSYTISGLGSASGRTEGQTIYWKVGAVDDATGAIYWSDVQNTSRVLAIAAPTLIDQLQLYPNPSSDLINISGLKTNDEVLIYDVHGSLVLKTKASSINISSLANGIYVARINTRSLRFVKQ